MLLRVRSRRRERNHAAKGGKLVGDPCGEPDDGSDGLLELFPLEDQTLAMPGPRLHKRTVIIAVNHIIYTKAKALEPLAPAGLQS